jgi:hypothetical protein
MEKGNFEDPVLDGMIILKWIFENLDGKDWIDVAQYRDRWPSLVNALMNLRVL